MILESKPDKIKTGYCLWLAEMVSKDPIKVARWCTSTQSSVNGDPPAKELCRVTYGTCSYVCPAQRANLENRVLEYASMNEVLEKKAVEYEKLLKANGIQL